ncbi:MAG: UDP-glucose 4-epimerase GalE [Idiomarina sp.]|nr:UDP-glucose 4-epimerase GalE [Idiomarina sp.]
MILVTGGAGYIGSHAVLELLNSGYEVVVIDNLSNGALESIERVERITNKKVIFEHGDIRDSAFLKYIFSKYAILSVMHFAGLKAVSESVSSPLQYYDVNVTGTLELIKAMSTAGINKIVFSSSATVYGEAATVPYVESMPRGQSANPYGASKGMVEQIFTDLARADERWSIVLLRYFNPIGAHESGDIGEDPKGVPNNLMPYISQVAVGIREKLTIFGNDYPTRDGTCERDYLHVSDLAEGHVLSLSMLKTPGLYTFNLGTGKPISVLEMVLAFQRVAKVELKYEFGKRRDGDLPAFWADASKAKELLGWEAKRDLAAMIKDTWNWQSKNPNGYNS